MQTGITGFIFNVIVWQM